MFSLVPDANNSTIITDSTSYLVTLPLNEVSNMQVTLQEFTIYFSPNELQGKHTINDFVFQLDGSGSIVDKFALRIPSVTLAMSENVVPVPNTLLTAFGSHLDVGTYNLTLLISTSFEPDIIYPIVNFTVNIVEGELIVLTALYVYHMFIS